MAISTKTRAYLDTCGYAQLALQGSDRIEIPAMDEMYTTFLNGNDPVVSKTLMDASMAKQHLVAKQQYDTTPEDQRPEGIQDPGELNQHLAQALAATRQAEKLYTSKRAETLSGLTVADMADYNSDANGNYIVATPANVREAISSTEGLVRELGEDSPVAQALFVQDNYRILGKLNDNVERSITQKQLAGIGQQLEALANN